MTAENSIKIVEAKNGQKIPIINELHLHSSYDPTKEAENFIDKNIKTIKQRRNILILGLGLGYHIKELIYSLKRFYGDNYQVGVVEPSIELIKINSTEGAAKDLSNVKIFSNDNPIMLYNNVEFLEFLKSSPGVLIHPASYNCNTTYFKSLLNYKAPDTNKDISKRLNDPLLKEYFSSFEENSTLNDIITIIQNKNSISGLDFLLMSYNEIK